MIQPQELRIGNLVGVVKPRYGERYLNIESITSEAVNIDFRSYNINELTPIPLTEEWLMKAGFTLNGTERILEYNDTTFIIEARDGEYYYSGGQGVMLSRLFTSVHQLQNVFHALTGEELKIEI